MTLNPSKLAPKRPSDIRDEWERKAWEVLFVEMWRQKISYKELSRRLEALGINETPDQINRKVNRKKFSAAFFLACLSAMEVESLAIGKGTTHSVR